MGISIVPEMVIEKNPPCRYLPIANQQAARTIGTVVLDGRYREPCTLRFPLPSASSIIRSPLAVTLLTNS